jgi:seryl-tRNA synthetase
MSLSFSSIIDVSTNSLSSLRHADVTDVYLYQNVSEKRVSVLDLYNEEIERRKQVFDYKTDDIDKNELEDINFLQNIIKIKSKISDLKEEHKSLITKSNNIQNEISKLEGLKCMYENLSSCYLSAFDKELNSDIMNEILTTIDAKCVEKDELDNKINNVLAEITMLKNIIRVDNVDNQNEGPLLDTELNPELLCFTCHESQITHCFNPCGHSFCEKCVSRVNLHSGNSICFMCRTKVNGKIKLYFS